MIASVLVYIYDRKKKAGPKTAASVELRLTLERKVNTLRQAYVYYQKNGITVLLSIDLTLQN